MRVRSGAVPLGHVEKSRLPDMAAVILSIYSSSLNHLSYLASFALLSKLTKGL